MFASGNVVDVENLVIEVIGDPTCLQTDGSLSMGNHIKTEGKLRPGHLRLQTGFLQGSVRFTGNIRHKI